MPFSQELSLIAVVVVVVLAFVIGLLVGRKSPAWLYASLAFCALLIALRFFLLRHPAIEYRLFAGDWYSMVRSWWVFLPSMFLIGGAVFKITRPSVRSLAVATAVVVFVVSFRTVYATMMVDHTVRMKNYPEVHTGLVTQTTTYSCGAASAAMLLHFEGIRASEGEMATICRTNLATATDEFSVRRGLREMLKGTGKDVEIEWIDFPSLLHKRDPPMMAIIALDEHLYTHWVVIKSITGDGRLEILDPMGSIAFYSSEEFKKVWKNVILYVK